MSGQPHRNFAVRKFLGFAARRKLKAEVFGLGQRDQLGLEDPARINAERLGLSARGRWRFQEQEHFEANYACRNWQI